MFENAVPPKKHMSLPFTPVMRRVLGRQADIPVHEVLGYGYYYQNRNTTGKDTIKIIQKYTKIQGIMMYDVC